MGRYHRHLLTLLLWPWPWLAAGSDEMEPPGDCTKQEHRDLKAAVGTACKAQPMQCQERQPCNELWARLGRYSACIAARKTIMDRCYRGGNADHRRVVEEYRKGQADCLQIITIKACAGVRCCDE